MRSAKTETDQSVAEASRAFNELVWMLGGGYLVSLYAYADESGIHDGSNAIVIAGWAAPVKQWKKFCRQWQAALNKHGAPYLHMRELQEDDCATNEKSPFYKWKRKRIDAFVNDMIPIARDNAVFGLVASVSKDGYKTLTPLLQISYPHPYVFAFRLFYEEMRKMLTGNSNLGFVLPEGKKCHLTLDQQKEYGPYAIQAFRNLKREQWGGEKFGQMNFAEARGRDAILPLQAADLLANRIYKAHESEVIRDEGPIKPGSWNDLLRSRGNLFLTYLTKEKCFDFVTRALRHYQG